MTILNPIYDVVFKYLMEDIDVAIDILEAINKMKIVALEMMPQEIATEVKDKVRVFRIDFKAVILTEGGEYQTDLIEIQKARTLREYQNLRFRRYLAKAYSTQEIVVDKDGFQVKKTLPIVPIYFLGFRLKYVPAAVAKVERIYRNLATGRIIKPKKKEPFIEQLSHDAYVIQIPRLKMEAATDIEKILDVFNQEKYKTSDSRILNYTGDMSDPRVARIVNRLHQATLDEELREKMLTEVDIEDELDVLNKAILAEKNAKDEALKLAEQERAQKEQERLNRIVLEEQVAELRKQMAALLEQFNQKSDN
jgi:hypothetical protein